MERDKVSVGRGRRGLSGSTLKWIAIGTMLIDHIGASLIEVYVMNSYGNASWSGFQTLSYEQRMVWYNLDSILRMIGRISFPLFCFLLVEGFWHTRDVKKYALRLGLFALVSEIPFDLAFFGEVFHPGHQNVFVTLFLALLGIWGLDYFRKKGQVQSLAGVLCLGAAALCAEWSCSDYDSFGVLLIGAIYLFHDRKILQAVCGSVLLLSYGGTESYGVLAFLPILLYNGNRGHQPKYFFYVFYPVHLLVLAALGYRILPLMMGI